MEGDGTGALNKRPSTQFKKKGANKKGKRSFRPEHRELPNPSDTIYRILCPAIKIGGVIGKGGGIIKALREDSKASISVSELIPGSDERVIMIYSAPDKILKEEPDEGNMEDVEDPMLPHCAAQDALMRVHDRILEEDVADGSKGDEDEFTARLLVPHNMVGCILGKGGDVIRRLRSETGANIRVLSSERLPTCALSSDEIVQIQGNPMALKKALYEASTLLHQNPRKEKALNFAMPFRGSGFHPAGPPVNNMPLHRNPMSMWSPRNPSPHMPPPPWMDDHASYPGFGPGGFVDGPNRPGVEASGEFSMKILCLDSKIGAIIGKGGTNVRQLQQETGTSIHVEDAPASSEERVIRVSAFETLRNTRSQTIDAILLLQNKASEVSDKGVITTKLLVPANKVGCLLGQGGIIINEMRRRTQADIRVYAKDEKQECALEDEELVQVSGSFAVARDALGEIASRLRARCLSDPSAAAEPPPHKPVQGHGPGGSLPRGGPPVPGPVQGSTPTGYSAVKGDLHDYEPPSYPVHPSASGYPVPNNSTEVHPPNNAISPIPGAGVVYSITPEAPPGTVDIHGGTDYYNAAPTSITHDYSGQNIPQQGSYSYPNGQGLYPSMDPQQAPHQSTYQNPHQVPYQPNSTQPSQVPYQPNIAQPSQVPYQPNIAQPSQHSAYESVPAQGAYQY